MSEQHTRRENQDWDSMTPAEVLSVVVYELYNPISTLGNHLNRLTADEDPLTEDEYEALFTQMHEAVNQLSKTVVQLRRYARDNPDAPPPA